VDSFRHILAAVLVSVLVPVLLYWPVLHGFIRFWRRIGPGWTFTLVWTGVLATAVCLFQVRGWYLRMDFGTSWTTTALGTVCMGVAGWLWVLLRYEVDYRFLLGLPEVAPDRRPQPLVCTGIYARIRHPRYVQLVIALCGWALVSNHLASYVVWLLWVLAVNLIVILEERELLVRYGEAYAQYARSVPRFLPRLAPLSRG
jgi:protein-S-isoprenylcysteine O-methyltransferase Ste14